MNITDNLVLVGSDNSCGYSYYVEKDVPEGVCPRFVVIPTKKSNKSLFAVLELGAARYAEPKVPDYSDAHRYQEALKQAGTWRVTDLFALKRFLARRNTALFPKLVETWNEHHPDNLVPEDAVCPPYENICNTFFIGDTHFGHGNVIKYDHRPYENEEEMDKALLENWNNSVSKTDIVYFLGDLCFGYSQERTRELVRKLNGRKRMVVGNHDNRQYAFYAEIGFERVYDAPVVLKNFFLLSHKPVYLSEDMPYMSIYAHVHNHEAFKDHVSQRLLCASCCRWDYKPMRCPEWDSYNPDERPDIEGF